MKKFVLVLYIFFIIALYGISNDLFSQNVGIGISNPIRAKFEVNGAAGVGATSAIFGGESTGISLQRNWPTVGFNQYRDVVSPGSQGKYMANGFAAIQYYDPTNGTMAFDMFPTGTANTFTPVAKRAITILNSGNVGIHSGGSNTASLYVTRGTNFDGAAIFGGTQHGSYFNYSNSEDTYIRAGKDLGKVIINDVPGGNIILGGGSNHVGINESSPRTSLQLNGAISINKANVTLTKSNYIVNVGNRSYIIITKATTDATLLIPTNGIVPGQILFIESDQSNGSSYFQLFSGTSNNTRLSSNPLILKGLDTLTLIWNGIYWLELSHSSNN
ncbi:MAG: hypothetical protein ABIO81_13570 [Ginsengibacter sp.]